MKVGGSMKFRVRSYLAVAAAGALVPAFLTACAGLGGAGLDRSQEVWRAFREGQVMEGHRYYTTGSMNAPDAILGIKDGYTLVTERWQEKQMTPQSLRLLVDMMHTKFGGSMGGGLLGSWVLSDTGERIGIWYSPVGLTTVEMLGEKQVRVSPPNPEAIRQLDPFVRGD